MGKQKEADRFREPVFLWDYFFVLFFTGIFFAFFSASAFAFCFCFLVLARLCLAVASPSSGHPPTLLIVPTTPTNTSASITQRSPY